MGGYSISETDMLNQKGKSGSVSSGAPAGSAVQTTISVVNPSLKGDDAGDNFVSSALNTLNVKKSKTSEYILQQRLIVQKEKEQQFGAQKLSDEEKRQKLKPFINLESVRRELSNKCKNAGISFSELMAKMSAITGKTPKEFNSMKPEIQELLLKFVMKSIDRIIDKNLPNVNIMEAVIADCALMYDFVFKENGEAIDIEKLTPEEISARRQNFELKLKDLKAKKQAELAKMTPEERAKAEKQIQEEFAAKRKQIFESLSKKVSFETAMELLLIVSVMDLGEEAKALMESFPIEIRKKIANTMHDINTFKEYIKLVQGRGESLGDEKAQEALDQYNKIFGTYKTKEKFEEYEEGFVDAVTRGELPEEVINPTAKGIGKAAYANINMTTEEKESFIKVWIRDNNAYLTDADMLEVEQSAKDYIKDLLDKNPELRERFSYVKKTIKEFVENTLEREFKPQVKKQQSADEKHQVLSYKRNKHHSDVEKSFVQKCFPVLSEVIEISQVVVDFAKLYIQKTVEKFSHTAIEKTDEQVVVALLRGVIDEEDAIKNLNNSEHQFILLCVKNEKLAEIYEERIMQYIMTENDNRKLEEIAAHAPRNIVEKMVKVMRGDKMELAEQLIKYNKIDYNTKLTLQQTVFGQYA